MNKFLDWVTINLSPKMDKITRNPWVSSIQESIYAVMPLILFGSIISMLGAIQIVIPAFPDLSLLSKFSFGLFGLFVAFLLPSKILEKKQINTNRTIPGLTSLGLFLMLTSPIVNEEGYLVIEFARLGGGGLMCSMIAGIFVALIWILFDKTNLFKKESALPDFVLEWFKNLIPVAIALSVGYIFSFVLGYDVFAIIQGLFAPLFNSLQTLPGAVLATFIVTLFYSLGISTHVFNAFLIPIYIGATIENITNASMGLQATNLFSYEPILAFANIGGAGMHLSLGLMFIFLAKSKRLNGIGKATIMPLIFNINEPLLYGTPIVFNPILMIPMWLNSIVCTTIIYFAQVWGFVPVATMMNLTGQMPSFMYAFVVYGFNGLILSIGTFILSGLIYYPFFKAYDTQLATKENEIKQ